MCIAAQVIYLKGWKYGGTNWLDFGNSSCYRGIRSSYGGYCTFSNDVKRMQWIDSNRLFVALLYNSPEECILISGQVWNAYNIASGLLGDTLSYFVCLPLDRGYSWWVFNELAFTMTDGMNIVLRSVMVFNIVNRSFNRIWFMYD